MIERSRLREPEGRDMVNPHSAVAFRCSPPLVPCYRLITGCFAEPWLDFGARRPNQRLRMARLGAGPHGCRDQDEVLSWPPHRLT